MTEVGLSSRDWATIEAALMAFGAWCGTGPQTDVNRNSDGWQCVDALRKINPRAADCLAVELLPRRTESK